MELLFGTAGIPISAKDRSTEEGIRRIKELGLDCMEIEFVRNVYMNEEKAQKVRAVAEKEKIALTVHAPYFINLNSKDKNKIEVSKQRIIDSARMGMIAGAKSVTFHPAFYEGEDPSLVYKKVKSRLIEIIDALKPNVSIYISPETTGKPSQFGSLDEILSLASEIDVIRPCVDFSHIYAREGGKYNSYKEFIEILEKIEKTLGSDALKELHIHISGMEYGPRGEKRHYNFEDKESKFNYKELIRALYDKKVTGYLICESPSLEGDALILQKIYSSILNKKERRSL